jgi:hypothetical protein
MTASIDIEKLGRCVKRKTMVSKRRQVDVEKPGKECKKKGKG